MDYQIMHFRDSDKIFESKAMVSDLLMTVDHVFNTVRGKLKNADLFITLALNDMGWVNGHQLNILPGHHKPFMGLKNGVAIDVNLNTFNYLQEGLMRLQVAHDRALIGTGILILPATRSDKSPNVVTEKEIKEDVESFFPTISMPVAVCVLALGSYCLPNCSRR